MIRPKPNPEKIMALLRRADDKQLLVIYMVIYHIVKRS